MSERKLPQDARRELGNEADGHESVDPAGIDPVGIDSIDSDSIDSDAIHPDAIDPEEAALDDDLGAFVEAIASSAKPRPIDTDVHERILLDALGLSGREEAETSEAAPLEPAASEAELTVAAALRRALDLAAKTSDLDSLEGVESPEVLRLVALARALRAAFAPTAIDSLTSERLLKPALALPSRRANRRVIVGATTVLVAMAAVFAGLWFRAPDQTAPSARIDGPALPMSKVRSTESLFDPLQPFPREGGASERIDKIESSRASDLRNNRFAAWGIE